MIRSPRAFFFLLLLAGALAVLFPRTGAAADHGATAHAGKTYTFHTAFETPIREILESRIKEAFARLDLKAELLYAPSSQRSLMRANQEGDGDAGRVTDIKDIAPLHTANLILVPEPIMIMELAVYSKDLSFPITGWQSLQNSHNGARIGSKILEENIPGKTTFLATTVQLVRMLDAGRIDTMVEWKRLADHAIRNVGSTDIRQLTPLLKVQSFHLCLHKKHAALIPKLNSVIKQMKEEGLLDGESKEFVFYTGAPSPLKEILERRLQEAFARAGNFRLRLVYIGSAQRSLLMANEEGDGDASRVPDIKEIAPDETSHLLLIPEAINDMRFCVYTTGPGFAVAGYESLAPLRNGFRIGAKILEKNVPGHRTMFPDLERLLQMLAEGRLDTVIEWDLIADPLLKQHGHTSVRKLSPPLINVPGYPLIHEKHRHLIPRIVKALQEMKADGTYSRIEEEVRNAYESSP